MRRFIACLLLAMAISGCTEQQPTTLEKPETAVVQQTVNMPQTVIVRETVGVPQTVVVVETVVVPQTVVVRETVLVIVEVASTPPPPPAQARPTRVSGLTPEKVVAAFKAAGLEAANASALTKDDYGLAPLVGDGVRFLIPSLCDDCGGRVFRVENPEDLARLRAYYDELGELSAMLFSWTFVRDDILVQINGDLPEETARRYESALNTAQ